VPTSLALPAGAYVIHAQVRAVNSSTTTINGAQCFIRQPPPGPNVGYASVKLSASSATSGNELTIPVLAWVTLAAPGTIQLDCGGGSTSTFDSGFITAIRVGALH
jgi:hypothetical protein